MRRPTLRGGDERFQIRPANAILATRLLAIPWPARWQSAGLDPGPHGRRDDLQLDGHLLDGQLHLSTWCCSTIGLPGMDGYAVAARLRAAGHAGTALVALTGYGREDDVRRSREAGFDHHLGGDPVQLHTFLRDLSLKGRRGPAPPSSRG